MFCVSLGGCLADLIRMWRLWVIACVCIAMLFGLVLLAPGAGYRFCVGV